MKGNGAFAARTIAKGTHIGDYEGELLDETTYWHRYPDGVVNLLTKALPLSQPDCTKEYMPLSKTKLRSSRTIFMPQKLMESLCKPLDQIQDLDLCIPEIKLLF